MFVEPHPPCIGPSKGHLPDTYHFHKIQIYNLLPFFFIFSKVCIVVGVKGLVHFPMAFSTFTIFFIRYSLMNSRQVIIGLSRPSFSFPLNVSHKLLRITSECALPVQSHHLKSILKNYTNQENIKNVIRVKCYTSEMGPRPVLRWYLLKPLITILV